VADLTAEAGQAQKALRETEDRYEKLLESVTTHTYSVTLDNGTPVSTTHGSGCLATTGFSPEEYASNPHLWIAMVHPDDREMVKRHVAELLAGKHVPPIEHRIRRKDGRLRWVRSTVVLHHDGNGQLHRYDGLIEDITERKQVEERFDLAVRGTDAGIWDWDLRTNEVYFSPHWKNMLGYEEDEIGKLYPEWENRLHPEDRERTLATIRAYLEGESTDYEQEHRLRHKDGTYRWILARGVAVFDESGKPYRMVGSHIDITQRKQMEAESREHEARMVAAQKIQQKLLPAEPPSLAGFDITGAIHPAAFAAGDLFDYLPMPDGSLGIVIGDVTGHGFAPALLMALTHAYLHTVIRTETDIAQMLSLVNRNLVHEVEGDRFVTLVLASLDPRSRSLTYASAGHPTGYMFDSSGNVKTRLESTGMPLAVLPDTVFPVSEPVLLVPGDVVILITDGVLEARSPEEEMFGEQRFLETVANHVDKKASEIIDGLYRAICDFSQREPPLDDIAVVVVKVNDVA
jgi:sigma-B regulation protein RsbU (phosphoserine phosphatase)